MKTSRKFGLEPKNRAKLRYLMQDEYDFYYFVQQRFYTIIDILVKDEYNLNTFSDVRQKVGTNPCMTASRELLAILQRAGLWRADCAVTRKKGVSSTLRLKKL